MGFQSLDGSGPPRVVMEQVTDRYFKLLVGFRYVDESGTAHAVRSEDLRCTDLASVPRPFQWFVGAHGRHTLAALLHDHQVTRRPRETRRNYGRRRGDADDLFLEMLRSLGVPWIRRNLMWGAVHAATRLLHHGVWTRLALSIWAGAAVGGIWNLIDGLRDGDLKRTAVAMLAPLVGALLWAVASRRPVRRWWCGVVVGYGVLIFVPALVLNGLALCVYAFLDLIAGGKGPGPWSNPDNCPDEKSLGA